MSKDYRTEFIRTVETTLINHFDPEQVNLISNVLAKTLAEYEITDRCTSIEPYDGGNERIIKQYAACLIVDGKSKNTVAQYVRTCRKLSETIGKPLTEMNAYDVRFFLAKEMERGISDQSRENQRANLSAFFQWMVNEEIIPKNPIAQIKPIKCHQEVKKAFSDIEIDALRSACKSLKERALIEFLLSTGARVSEVAEMKVRDVNIETLSVHILHGKGDKERITYTTAVGMKHLLAYIHSRKETGDALFYSKNQDSKSGGETQTPFYALIAGAFQSVVSLPEKNKLSPCSLVVFDEAFNNMDGERIKQMLEFYKELNIQLIISVPSSRFGYISPYADNIISLAKVDNSVAVFETISRETK